MAYTSDDDVRYYLSALGSASGGVDGTTIGTYAVSLNIAYSDSIIDMVLSKRYSVPFSPTPPAIKSISTTLSSWKSLRGIFSNEIPSALQFVEDDYKKAMSFLGSLQESYIDLPDGSGGVVSERGHATKMWASNMDYTPIFDVDDEANWAVDSDRLDAIEDDRA